MHIRLLKIATNCFFCAVPFFVSLILHLALTRRAHTGRSLIRTRGYNESYAWWVMAQEIRKENETTTTREKDRNENEERERERDVPS